MTDARSSDLSAIAPARQVLQENTGLRDNTKALTLLARLPHGN